MNQRTSNGKVKEVRNRDKFRRPRQEDEWDAESVPHRSSSEKNLPSAAETTVTAPAFYGGSNVTGNRQTGTNVTKTIGGEKTRSRSRDGHVVYRRQERGKIRSGNFSQPTPENSPPLGRVSHSDTMRDNSGLTRHGSGGRSNSGTFYKQKSSIGTSEHGSRMGGGKIGGSHHESLRKGSHENEDSRLFRILNRLNNDSDRERQIIALRQLKDFFLNPDNAKSVETSYYNIISYFDEVLQMRLHADIRHEIAQCLGSLGPILEQDCKAFFEWIFNNYFADLSDDVKIMLLRILLENLKNDKDTQKVNQLMEYIMSNTQVALENADIPDLLTAIVDVITFIASAYPSVFRSHFRDIVDILVGWHIDPTQMSCLTQYTSKALISFQQFWIADMTFSLTLLGQFLEDMEAYSEDLVQTKDTKIADDSPPANDECLDKISSLVRVFMTVLKSLGNHASPNQNPSMTWNFLIDSVKCLFKCTLLIIDYAYDEELITAANDCATLLLVLCQVHAASTSDDLLKYVGVIQSFPVENSSEVYLLSLLRLMGQAIKELGTQLPLDFIQYIFGPDSICQKLKFSPYHKIQQQLLSLQRAILGLKNVPLLEEAYRCLLQNLQDGFSELLGEDTQLISTTSCSPNFDTEPKNLKKAEVTVLSCLCALAEIGNAKHSIIGMWALKPSFFDLVAHRLKPTSKSLATRFPAVHFSILYTLYSHCSRHGHFVSSSTLLSQSLTPSDPSGATVSYKQTTTSLASPILGNVSMISPPSSGHLSSILTLLTTVVKLQGVSYDCRSLCMRWIQEIVESLQHHAAKLCHLTEFLSFVEIILDSCFLMNPALSISSCLAMQILLKNAGSVLPENLLRKCYEACVLRLGSNNTQVCEAYSVLLALLPLGIATSGYPFSVSKLGSQNQKIQNLANGDDDLDGWKISMQDIWAAQHGYMTRTATGEFSAQMFKKVLAYILLGQKPKDKDWQLNMYCAYQQLDRQTKTERLLWQVSRFNTSSLWFWATWESAQHCVLYKLRTALGKPQETFTTIEGALKMYAGDISKVDRKTGAKASDRLETLLRVKLLLQFMEHLEKSMYNAYEGCSMALPSAPKNVRSFFRTNKGTCLEWLSRVRLATVKVALQAGEYPTAVRHGYQLLQEKIDAENTQSPDFERLLIYLVHALTHLQNPEAVLGLYVWLREKTGRKYVWVKAAVDHAAGKYETACTEYACVMKSLRNVASPPINKTEDSYLWHKDEDEQQTPLSKTFQQLELQDNPTITNDQYLQSFLLQQNIDCYRSLGSWNDVLAWTERKGNATQNGRLYHNTFDDIGDLSYIQALSSFEDNLRVSAMGGSKTLADCELLDAGMSCKSAPVSWELDAQQIWAEQTLVNAAFTYYNKAKPTTIDTDAACDQMQKVAQHLSSLIQISCRSWPPTVIPRVGALYLPAFACSTAFQKGRKISPAILSENIKLDPPDFSTSVLSSSLAWTSLYQHVTAKEQNVRPQLGSVNDLTLTVARLARKQQNIKLAQRLLVKNALSISGASYVNLNEKSCTIADMIELVNTMPFNEKLMKVQREGAKLLFASGNVNGAIDALINGSITATNFVLGRNTANDLRLKMNDHTAIGEEISRSLLCIVKYVQHDSKVLPNFGSHQSPLNLVLENLLNLPLDLGLPSNNFDTGFKDRLTDLKDASFSKDGVIGDSEVAVGRLLQRCVFQCPQLAKAWSALAAWCYRWGRKVVDASSDGCIELLPEEKNEILELTPINATTEECEAIIQVMSQLHVTPEGDWEELGLDAYSDSVEITRYQLLNACPALENTQALNYLIKIWCQVVKRAYCYYELAAKAYFQYLQLNAQQPSNDKYEDDNVTATLRLLRLVVKHATELRDVLEVELAKTPTGPWRGIIPQLFSRLSHPELYVRQSISDLLCRVAQASPHLIVFPAVVGSLTLKSNNLKENPAFLKSCLSQELGLNDNLGSNSPDHSALTKSLLPRDELEDEELEQDEDDSQKAAIMQNCFAVLVDTLARQDACTIEEVKNLVHELRRITLLWDELWLGSLNLHHQEMQRRIQNLEDEISKVQSSATLTKEEKTAIIKEKYSIFMKPTLFILEQLQNITIQTAETPHEQRFQDTFGKLISDTIANLKEPTDPSKPQQSWLLIRKLHQTLQQRIQQQTRSSLFLDQISPVLSTLQSTVIPMPGINNKSTTMVTIKSVQNTISILPTKTRPKKLAFFGSDGKKYNYLFKGLEDLHLDERIMQFLSIVNNMFVKSRKRGKALYNARHYSVTPLGPRSGLIEWVDGASPLFGLYKRWQQREVTAQALKTQNNPSAPTPTMLRPSEIYYNKLTPLLKEKDISNLDNRKEWPQQVMLQVLQELMNETPKDLLAKELWCSCSSASGWWEVTQTYNHSTAVMSVIGYIIGLGDRHLDNVLVDLSTGEVVHIDYNVCFEKGKNLRVPEKVPFRMTPNIETALGVTGIEGIFRVSCEHVLRVLRKGRETLLTLLEAFVYDPLVDWTPGNEGGYTGAVYGGGQIGASDTKQAKQQMEQDIAQAMLAVRVAEMKADWIKNRDELIESFPKLEAFLKNWVAAQSNLNAAEIHLQDTCQQRAILEEALGNNQHSLYTLPQRYEEYSIVKNVVMSTQEAVKEKIAECNKWQNLHTMAVVAMTGPELGKWCAETTNDLPLDVLSVAPVVEFLQTAGQGHLVQQSEHAESELGSLLQQQKAALRNCVELVRTYATVIMNYPPDYIEQNRCYQFKYWLESLLTEFNTDRCQQIITEFHNKYRVDSVDINMVQISISVQFQLESHIADVNTKISHALDRRRREGLDDPEMLASLLEQSRSAIAHFLKENGEQGYSSLQCFVVSMVSGLGKKLLMMENAASAAGDCLVDLTSWEGDWFLDELCSTMNHICQLFRMVQQRNLDSTDVDPAIQSVFAVYNVFNALEDLSLNFQNIILPEAVKSIQTQEPSVLEMIEKLHNIINWVGIPLETVMEQLEKNTRDIIIGKEMNDAGLLQIVIYLRTEFNSIIPLDPNAVELSPGQMLYMGLNGLFSKLDSDMCFLLESLAVLDIPTQWKKVDIVREASALLPPVQLEGTRINLTAIFFLKKLHAMQQFFILAQRMAESLQINNIHLTPDYNLPTEDQLFKPIKIFIAEYIRKHVLGLASQAVGFALCSLMKYLDTDVTAEIELRDIGAEGRVALDQLAKVPFEVCSRLDKFNSPQLSQTRTLIQNFDAAWRKDDMARRVDQSIVQYKSTVHRLQLQLARHQWLYEDLLVQGNIGPLQNVVPPSRVTVMSEMRKSVQGLLALESSVAASQDRYLSLTAGIEQRMKWAAGANPSLAASQTEFEIAIAKKTGLVINSTQITHELVNVCNAILHFEALRTRTNEAINSDNSFLSLINKCQESCMLAEGCSNQATPIEEHLLSLLPLPEEGGITQDWIAKLLEKVSLLLAASKEKLENQKIECFAHLDIVKTHIYSIRNMLTTHHKIMSELRNILKSLAKLEEQGSGNQGPIQAYINRYKTFSESVSKIVCNVIRDNEEMEPNQIEKIASQLEQLKRTTYDVYEELLELAGPLTMSNSNGLKQTSPSITDVKEETISSNPKSTANRLKAQEHLSGVSPTSQNHPPRQGSTENSKKGTVTRDPRTGKVIQERNTYATNVWKRVKMKLDGRDPDPNKRSSVAEQVDYVIKEATNLDNLAVLYEGWTSWV